MGMITSMPPDLEQSTTVARLAADQATALRIIDLVTESYDPLAAVAGASEDGPGHWAVAIHFRDPPNETAVRALVALSAGPDAANKLWFETTTPKDWVKASHEGLKPIEAGRFVVHTPHYRGHAPLNRITIEIEASLAFGTGHHGTTRGCLLALDRIVKQTRKQRKRHAIASRALRRAAPHRSLPHASLGLPAVGQSGATAFPPPLWGRDRERGTIEHYVRLVRETSQKQTGVVLTLGALSPPLSLSLPHKGGGNRVARIIAPHARRPRTVLDIGTGTGVLAIAAARALRCRVMASDIDPVAVKVARANVRLNRSAEFVELMRADGLGVKRLAGRYDIILANILLAPLQRLATPIARNLAPGGWVVLSGLLRGQAVFALAPYIARGLILKERIPLEGWMTLVLERRVLRHKARRWGVAARRSGQ
jgi:ribosomal protein L11 methylase PrmA